MRTIDMTIDLKPFLLAAKRATYAAQGDEASVSPLLPDSKQLEFSKDQFFYRDIYVGLFRFVGQEIVYHDGRARWSMSYSGGLCPDVPRSSTRAIYAFVRKALLAIPVELPLRGPAHLAADGMTYTCQSAGSFERFHGLETIVDDNACLYELHFSGGMLA
jgi:hypothetical protein